MTTFNRFCANAKMRRDYSDMIQVRYHHPNGEDFDTWVSGEEVMQRLETKARERLIKSFSQKNWHETKKAVRQEIEKSENNIRRGLKDRLADALSDQIGGNIFGDTLTDNIRGKDSKIDPYDQEKALWQSRLKDKYFRTVLLRLAWINLEGTLPDEASEPASNDWI